MAINKVEYGGETLIDLTNDNVSEQTLVAGTTAHAANGEQIIGTFNPSVYLEKTGDASNTTVAFTQASSRVNIATGEKLSTIFSKIKKFFADLKSVAFSGSASDLTSGTLSADRLPALPVEKLSGIISSANLPSYVDDVLEYSSKTGFPSKGEAGKIYVDTTTNLTYRWSGTAYVEISPSLALGTTSATAYRGDYGNTAYQHSRSTGNPHKTTAADIGLGNVNNTADTDKSVKYATSAGNATKVNDHTVNADVPSGAKFTDTTYDDATTSKHGLMSVPDKKALDILNNPLATCATGRATAAKAATLSNFTLSVGKTIAVKFTDTAGTANPTSGNLTLNVNGTGAKAIAYFRNGGKSPLTYANGSFFYGNQTHIFTYDGTYWLCIDWNADNNTTYSLMTGATASAAGKAGLVPVPVAGKQGQFLRGDGTWATPTNTTYNEFVKSGAGAKAGLVPTPPTTAGSKKYLCEDGEWSVPTAARTLTSNDDLNTISGFQIYQWKENTPKNAPKDDLKEGTGISFGDIHKVHLVAVSDGLYMKFDTGGWHRVALWAI